MCGHGQWYVRMGVDGMDINRWSIISRALVAKKNMKRHLNEVHS